MCCCGGGDEDDCRCRPLGFLLGLPFAFVALILSVIGVIIWIVGLTLSCLCPCCFCVTVIIELALALIKAPFSVMKWFTEQIPC
uniref:signaling peptide TAXIMIN 1-like n=1 Tax=Erigeron canadensis TaxID=72917 RepID=UPI001CB8F531|nr:signaling peptide TAXIMIN 1-like [Erigeron canadensis]